MDWRTYFDDPALEALIAESLARSPDLQVALQRIEIARAGVHASSGALLPQISVVAGASVTRYGRFTIDGSGAATTEIVPGRITPNPVAELSLGLQASWEVDIWGKLRNLQGAARGRYLATVEGASLVVSNLVSEVAVTYFELLALDHIRDVLKETGTRQTQAVEMARVQKAAGRVNELAVQQLEAQLAGTRAMEAGAAQQTREVEVRLNVLIGRFPRPIARAKDALLRDVATSMATGVPSDLLRNRPDVREAERLVEASRFDVRAARAAFYPSVTITAGAGYGAFTPRFLLRTPESLVASIAGGLLSPLVNRRGIEAELAAAKATQIEAIYRFQAIVLSSFAEVAVGLSALEQLGLVVTERQRRKAAVAGTVEAADLMFRAGKATYLDVLLAQQNTLEANLELIQAHRDHHIARVRLYKALGGGWQGTLRSLTNITATSRVLRLDRS